MDMTQEVQAVEKELAELIIANLKNNKIELEKARILARDFLAALPVASQKDLLDKLKALGQKYGEVQEVYVEELGKVQKSKEDQTLFAMRDAIKTGNIEQAIQHAKSLQGGTL